MSRLREIDLQYVWHPFTQMKDFRADEDLIMVRGQGNYLYDEEGRRYFDATSSLWVTPHGHNHPALNAAVRHQVGKLAHSTLLGIGNEAAALLAERLVRVAPGRLSRVFYSDNGSTAVEVALKMAFQYHRHRGATGEQRSRFVSLANGYHGDTVGSVSVGGMDLFHSIFQPLLFHTHLAPSPNCYRCPFGREHPGCGLECVAAMGRILEAEGDAIAAVVVEPLIQGAGGMVIYPPEVLRGYAEAARRHGVLLIVDEVATGFGRTGTMFACERAGVVPDVICLGKALTAGTLSFAAAVAPEHVYEAFLADWVEFKTFFHGHTFTGNPLGCAVALANLDLVEAPDFLPRVRRVGEHLGRRLERLAESHPNVGDARLLGMMAGIELVADKGSRKPLPTESRTGHRVCLAAREAGVLARPLSDVLVLMPPLSATAAEVDHLVDALEYGIDRVVRGERCAAPRRQWQADPAGATLLEARHAAPAADAHRLLVTGTDTGVGKTVALMALARAAAARKHAVCAYKPVESGVADAPAGTTDRERLASVSTRPVPGPELSFGPPLSPHLAARLAGTEVPFEAIAEALQPEPLAAGVTLVEGAGGLLVPFAGDWTFADLARETGLAVLVVVGDKLGCLNHTLLTVRMVNDIGLPLAGVVLHRLVPGTIDPSQDYNEAELRRLLGDHFLGVIPYIEDLDDPAALAAAGEEVARRLWE